MTTETKCAKLPGRILVSEAIISGPDGNQNSAQPDWKCKHGVYSDTGSCGPYCSPETLHADKDSALAFKTCEGCRKTLAIDKFPGDTARNCLDCARQTVSDPTLPVAERKKEYGLRRRARHGDGDFTMAAWLEKVAGAGWVCTFCECALTSATLVCTRWIPRSHGGRNDISNCAPACKRCTGIFSASWRGDSQLAA